MSDYKVPYTRILDIKPHNNAERLEVATVYGFQVVVGKGQYQIGDYCIYVPIDSILPQALEDSLFPAGSKIKLNNHRVRQIRIRGLASQGMLISTSESFFDGCEYWQAEKDYAEELGITKYEPPVTGSGQTLGGVRQRSKIADHPLFHKYNGLDSIKWFPDLFQPGEKVVVQEKLHGTNARASILPFIPNTLWKKFLKLIRLAPQYENHYGSNNVQISGKVQGWKARLLRLFGITAGTYTGYYGEDTYGKAFAACGAFGKMQPGDIIYGEIIGPGIQKGYDYGLKEPKFILFDVKQLQPDTGKFIWLNPGEAQVYALARDFEYIPELYIGPYSKEKAYQLTFGPSEYCPEQKVREGIVIKAENGYDVEGNKRALKWVSEIYLDDKSNSDNH